MAITHSDARSANIEEDRYIKAIKLRRENGETKLSEANYADEAEDD